MTPVTLAIPHWKRFNLLLDCVERVIDDARISEIVISDDCSNDGSYERLLEHFADNRKVKIFRNGVNQDCYRNKMWSVERATKEWVILFDDDNIIGLDYLDALWRIESWERDIAYLPTFAYPHFDYRAFSGYVVDKWNLPLFINQLHFLTALNTCNYFVHRATYLSVWDGSVDPHTADSLYQNYNWLKAGHRLHFVDGLQYSHRVHEGSHFKKNAHLTGNFAKEIEQKLKQLK